MTAKPRDDQQPDNEPDTDPVPTGDTPIPPESGDEGERKDGE